MSWGRSNNGTNDNAGSWFNSDYARMKDNDKRLMTSNVTANQLAKKWLEFVYREGWKDELANAFNRDNRGL